MKPALSQEVLDKRLLRDLEKFHRKQLKNSLNELLPQALIPVVIQEAGIPGERPAAELTREERQALADTLKGLQIPIKGVRPMAEAIVTPAVWLWGKLILKPWLRKSWPDFIWPGSFWTWTVIPADIICRPPIPQAGLPERVLRERKIDFSMLRLGKKGIGCSSVYTKSSNVFKVFCVKISHPFLYLKKEISIQV